MKAVVKIYSSRLWMMILMLFAVSAIFSGEIRANNAEEFKAACMPKCSGWGHKADFCAKYCQCNAVEMQKKFGDKAFSRQPSGNIAPEEFLAVPSLCNARYVEGYFETAIAKQCGGDADCAQTQRCVAKELRAMGEAEAGALMMALVAQAIGKADPVKLARYKELGTVCVGRNGAKATENGCLQSCGTDATCQKSCACLGKKIAGLGADLKIGEFITKFQAGDAATVQQRNAMLGSCGLEPQ